MHSRKAPFLTLSHFSHFSHFFPLTTLYPTQHQEPFKETNLNYLERLGQRRWDASSERANDKVRLSRRFGGNSPSDCYNKWASTGSACVLGEDL